MLNYIISVDEKKQVSISALCKNEIEHIQLGDQEEPLFVDRKFLLSKYGVELSDFELQYFKANHAIWEHFMSRPEEWCLIREDRVAIKTDEGTLFTAVEELPEDWDVFFPFDKAGDDYTEERSEIYTSVLGYYWGSHIYFLSKNGALKLLNTKAIRQPVDEEILSRSSNEELEVYTQETDYFEYDDKDAPSYIERKRALTTAIMDHPAWTGESKEMARRLIKYLAEHAKSMNIDLVLCGGTLLGAIRHHGIMPWDDDIDFGILHSEIDRFVESVRKEGIVKVISWPWNHRGITTTFYKFWFDDGKAIPGYPYKFPFVDVWLFYNEDEKFITYKEGFTYSIASYLPLVPVTFEGSELKMPIDPMTVLDGQYDDWRKYILVYNYCHRLESPVFSNLKLPITIDEKGYLVM